jgi:hypothetical protein
MNTPAESALLPSEAKDSRLAGVVIAAASVASVLLMAKHPHVGARAMVDVVSEMSAKAATDRLVHAALIALMGALLFAFGELSRLLGMRRATVRAALLAYAIGTGAMMGAALISGFVVPALASQYAGASAAELEGFRTLAVLSTIGNQTLAQFAVASTSVAVFLWSLALMRGPRALPGVAILGLLVAVGPVAALLTGLIALKVTGMSLVVGCQTLWNLAVAVPMIRRRLGEPLTASAK